MRTTRRRLPALTSLVVAVLLGVGGPVGTARASDDDRDRRDEVRIAGRCGPGATSKLKLKADDETLELELEVDQNRNGVPWRVAIVHERRVVWKGTVRTRPSSGSFTVERTLPDLPGADTVTVRATGPRGLICRATATLPAS